MSNPYKESEPNHTLKPKCYRVRYTVETVVTFDGDEDPSDHEIVQEAMTQWPTPMNIEITKINK